ncbi:hypothetical protein BH23CHL5_BH23CHL5_02050 [soil metagenome]
MDREVHLPGPHSLRETRMRQIPETPNPDSFYNETIFCFEYKPRPAKEAAVYSLWAKKRIGAWPPVHPLIYHLIDVAAVAEALWREVVPESTKHWVSNGIGVHLDEAGAWISCWSGLHDIGKASQGFQSQIGSVKHGVVSAVTLEQLLQAEPFDLHQELAIRVAVVVGGHHGVFPRSSDLESAEKQPTLVGSKGWAITREELADAIARLLDVPALGRPVHLDNPRVMWLAGMVSVADWIGSNEQFFPFTEPGVELSEYFDRARVGASTALDQLGWNARPATTIPRNFSDLFDFDPNDLQAAVIQRADEMNEAGLVVIEAPMGEGKTEAALYIADRGNIRVGMRGHYLALPTMATSSQMFNRDVEFLQRRYDDELINAQLMHGHASLSAEFRTLKESGRVFLNPGTVYGEKGHDGAAAGVIAAEWFSHRKRGLLAPFGIGTVDQMLLAVLQTRHVFVRLFGLAGKTIVIDEVHAYDTYMTTILERLLAWLAALGSTVVLLSATLPSSRRKALVAAYEGGRSTTQIGMDSEATYPRVTWRFPGQSESISVGASERSTKDIAMRWMTHDEGGNGPLIASELAVALTDGGCAAVICNTVREAQDTYLAVRDSGLFDASEVDLLHARFLFKDREKREKRVLERFGKTGKRPARAVLVATQVIEQSLDLDFDLMVTDLAPVDLVLQRSGRLHRHSRDNRPSLLNHPQLWIIGPLEVEGAPSFSRSATYVYDEHILLRSWLALKDRRSLRAPEDIEPLIEGVYGDGFAPPDDGGPAMIERWITSAQNLQQRRQLHESIARQLLLLPPASDEEGFLEDANRQLEEDDPTVHPQVQAMTRLGDLTVSTICLPPDSTSQSRGTDAAFLLRHSVAISDPRIVHQLIDMDVPAIWKKSALLRHCRILELDETGGVDVGQYRVEVDSELGVRVMKQNGG